MAKSLRPRTTAESRADVSEQIRLEAAALAKSRIRPPQTSNAETEDALTRAAAAPDTWIAAHTTFTKGLTHDAYGRVLGSDLIALTDALQRGPVNAATRAPFAMMDDDFDSDQGTSARIDIPYFKGPHKRAAKPDRDARRWESAGFGHSYDLLGADADTFGLPPAPALGSDELTAEMAELYGAALLRDVPFEQWSERSGKVAQAIAQLPFFTQPQTGAAARRRAARGAVTADTVLKGFTRGANQGPYVSQFMIVGSKERDTLGAQDTERSITRTDTMTHAATDAQPQSARFVSTTTGQAHGVATPALPSDGFIRYGVQSINQRFTGHMVGFDHLTEWASWRDVQNGANRKDSFDRYQPHARFAATPRDLASYVHFDIADQAFRNAALLLLGAGQPTDIGLPEGPDSATRDANASFGGTQILTLLSEVTSRALKAVHRQKYTTHLRARPEAIAAGIALAAQGGEAATSLGAQRIAFERMAEQLRDIGLLDDIIALNKSTNDSVWAHQYSLEGGVDLGPLTPDTNALLPQAYPEGSPMQPSYGAAHAAVAGACVTILKAYFEMFELPKSLKRGALDLYAILTEHSGYPTVFPPELFGPARHINGIALEAMLPDIYAPDPSTQHTTLMPVDGTPLSVQGELDKLASNIAMGRSFAGVHTYSDAHEALRLGERVAVALLQEQMLTLREAASMRFNSFDGDLIMVAGTGGLRAHYDALVLVWDDTGHGGTRAAADLWWQQESSPAKMPVGLDPKLGAFALKEQPRAQNAQDIMEALMRLAE